MNNDVWEILPNPEGQSVVPSKCIYKIKHTIDGSIEKYKAIFVSQGLSHKEGIYDEETFATLTRYTSIKTIMELVFVLINPPLSIYVRIMQSSLVHI